MITSAQYMLHYRSISRYLDHVSFCLETDLITCYASKDDETATDEQLECIELVVQKLIKDGLNFVVKASVQPENRILASKPLE